MRDLADIEAELSRLDIPIDEVEFYNHPNFLVAEQNNPALLETYCDYVACRKYSKAYLDRSQRVISLVTDYLYEELKRDGKQGACLDFVQTAMKILERLGIWCCAMAGSLTIDFDPETKLGPIPTIHQLMKPNVGIARMLNKFHPFSVKYDKMFLKYFPCRTGAISEKFEDAKAHCFSGQNVPELFAAMAERLGDQLD